VAETRISGFPAGTPPSSEFRTLPRSSAASAPALLTLARGAGHEQPVGAARGDTVDDVDAHVGGPSGRHHRQR